MFNTKHLLRLTALLFFFGLVFFVAAPARADDGVTITITNPTDREYSFVMLGPNFRQMGSAHATKTVSFTGVAGTYSYDITEMNTTKVVHGEFQITAGGTATINAPTSGLALSLTTPPSVVAVLPSSPARDYDPVAGKGTIIFRNISQNEMTLVVYGTPGGAYNLHGDPAGQPRTRTPNFRPTRDWCTTWPPARWSTTTGSIAFASTAREPWPSAKLL